MKGYQSRDLGLFLGPTLGLFIVLLVIPILYSAYLAFSNATYATLGNQSYTFVGWKNFVSLIQDESFLHSVKLLTIFMVTTTTLEIILGTTLAITFDQVVKLPRIFQSLVVLPMFVIPVVSGLTFRYIFDPQSGVLATVFLWFEREPPDILGDPTLAMVGVILQDIWRMWPFIFLIVLAGLKSMPRDPIEAIKMDGANFWQTCRYVILPSLKGTLVIAAALKIVESLKAFTEIYVMTGGGPGDSTSILSMFIVKHVMEFTDYGYGSAASTLLLMVGIGAAAWIGWRQRTAEAAHG